MSDEKTSAEPMKLGVFAGRSHKKTDASDVIAAALSGFWLAACAIFFLLVDTDGAASGGASGGLNFVMVLLAVFLPIAVIWLAASAAKSARVIREETARLQSTIDTLRHNYLTQSQAGAGTASPEIDAKLKQLERAQKETETALATFSTRRQMPREEMVAPKPKPTDPIEVQTAMELETGDEDQEPLELDDFIRALHFPEDANDQAGFDALRRALKDHKAAGLVQAAQDVLTLMSQDGIYMDDLNPDHARPEFWRHFAQGARGRAIAPLGGVRDRSSLALSAGRMRHDPIFRDAVHHFLRRFDQVFADFEKTASDEEIVRLANTRTARAFMLLGRVTGTFD